jgi:hypothetical protein
MQLTKTLELIQAVRKQCPSSEYFSNFESSIDEMPDKRKHWEFYESRLLALADSDWSVLLNKIVPRFRTKDQNRGWQTAIDGLNEAVAYDFFKTKGMSGVMFVQETNTKTPDIIGSFHDIRFVSEVKTINVSDIELNVRRAQKSNCIEDVLSTDFFHKFENILKASKSQLCDFLDVPNILFVIPNFDDSLHEYAESYFSQISKWLDENNPPFELIILYDKCQLWRDNPLVHRWGTDFWKNAIL